MSIEERVRDAFGAAAEEVRPGTLRECPAPRRRRPWLLNASPRRAVVPLATAALVVVIAVAASLGTSQLTRGHSAGGLGSLRATLGMPRYFMTVVGEFSPLIARDARTGKVLGQVPAPRGTSDIVAVAGTEDDRTFLVVADGRADGTCAATFYRLRLDGHGLPGPLVPLGVTIRGIAVNDLAVTPDGRVAAFAASYCNGHTGQTSQAGELVLINLQTHQTRRWTTTSIPWGPSGLSFTADGSLLSFTSLVPAGYQTVPSPAVPGKRIRAMRYSGPATLVLSASAPEGPAVARARIVLPAVAAPVISSDGTRLYGCTTPASIRVNGILLESAVLSEYDATTGQRLRVLHSWPPRLAGDLCQPGRDASGRYLLVLRPGQFGLIDIASGRLADVLPITGLPVNEAITSIAW